MKNLLVILAVAFVAANASAGTIETELDSKCLNKLEIVHQAFAEGFVSGGDTVTKSIVSKGASSTSELGLYSATGIIAYKDKDGNESSLMTEIKLLPVQFQDCKVIEIKAEIK